MADQLNSYFVNSQCHNAALSSQSRSYNLSYLISNRNSCLLMITEDSIRYHKGHGIKKKNHEVTYWHGHIWLPRSQIL